eukprot:COSAG02_NODE_205_length_29157_cov_13.424771_20_plen_118_part_00
MACPFFDSPASSKGGAADRSEKRQRRRRSPAGRLRREKSGEGAEAISVSRLVCASDHPRYSRSASSRARPTRVRPAASESVVRSARARIPQSRRKDLAGKDMVTLIDSGFLGTAAES